MSLIVTYHTKDSALICSDSRLSRELSDGKREVLPGIQKFVALRADLVLCMTGFSVLLMMRVFEFFFRYARTNPDATFDHVARMIIPVVREGWAGLPTAVPSDARAALILVGFDMGAGCIRNREFKFIGQEEGEKEHEPGFTVNGYIPEMQATIGPRIRKLIGSERSIEAARSAAVSIMDEISAVYPDLVGPPYFFHTINAPSSLRTT